MKRQLDPMMTPTYITFVRHGHVHNPQAVYYGRLPGFHLSQEGRRQAAATASVLQDQPIAAMFSSPQRRTRETAQILLQHHPDLSMQIHEKLNEVHTPFDGRPIKELEERGWDAYTGASASYEQPQDVLTRARQFIAEVRQIHMGQHVVAVTHGDLIAFLILWAKGLAAIPQHKSEIRKLGIADGYPAPASISKFVYHTAAEDEVPHLAYANPTLSDKG
jgi:broad specificity phosphatase PhoE